MERRAVFNRLSLDVPGGWEDNTMVALSGPAKALPKTLSPRPTEAPRPSFMLRRIAVVAEPVDLEIFAREQEQMVSRVGMDLRPIERQATTLGPGIEALVCDYTLHAANAVLRQVNAYFQAGDILYVASGSALLDDSFTSVRETFLGILRSLRIERN